MNQWKHEIDLLMSAGNKWATEAFMEQYYAKIFRCKGLTQKQNSKLST